MSLEANERSAIIGQLVAMRNVLDGIIAAVSSLEDAGDTAAIQDCLHPEELRKYARGTMGQATSFTCQQCGQEVPLTVAMKELNDVTLPGA